MNNIGQIEQYYNFTSHDIQNLQQLQPLMSQYKDQLVDQFCNTILQYDETVSFLPNTEFSIRQRESFIKWFMDMFGGVYDNRYLQNINKIGCVHVKTGIGAHFMNSSVYLVREFVNDIINNKFENTEERYELSKSFNKILDINLEIMATSYRHEELKNISLSYRLENSLIRLAERFSYGLNLFLVIALIGLSIVIIGLLSIDIWKLITDIQHDIIHVLGTLLMLWVMIELMNTEIKHLKKGHFSITIFVEVALVAFIRDALVTALEHGEIIKQTFLVSTILVLGIVYWLISKADEKKNF